MAEWQSQLKFIREQLNVNDIAHYDPGKMCLPGTRKNLLDGLEPWIDGRTGGTNVRWIHGNAGAGKSTIAHTVADMALKRGALLYSFFCKRDNAYLSNPSNIFPALAYHLARQDETYLKALLDFFRHGNESVGITTTVNMASQVERLFKKLLNSTPGPGVPPVITVDAIDECGTPQQQNQLVKALLDFSQTFPWVQILITSRDEREIKEAMTLAESEGRCTSVQLTNDARTLDDIRQYIRAQAKVIRLKLSDEDVDSLASKSEGLFIWCSTVFRSLANVVSPRDTLDKFLSNVKEKDGTLKPLYQLYQHILDTAVRSSDETSLFHTILAIIHLVSVNRPLPSTAIAALLVEHPAFENRHANSVVAAVTALHAVLHAQPSDGHVRAYHTSFYDFIDSQLKSEAWLVSASLQSHISRRCLAIMHEQLRFNICKIKTPVLNKDIRDLGDHIRDNISPELQYSTLFWARHLLPDVSGDANIRRSIVSLLSTEQLLFWLECISLQNAVPTAVAALVHVVEIFEVERQLRTRWFKYTKLSSL